MYNIVPMFIFYTLGPLPHSLSPTWISAINLIPRPPSPPSPHNPTGARSRSHALLPLPLSLVRSPQLNHANTSLMPSKHPLLVPLPHPFAHPSF